MKNVVLHRNTSDGVFLPEAPARAAIESKVATQTNSRIVIPKQPDKPHDAWRDCQTEKPQSRISVRLLMPDNTVRIGFWNGSSWIVAGVEVAPVKWQDLS